MPVRNAVAAVRFAAIRFVIVAFCAFVAFAAIPRTAGAVEGRYTVDGRAENREPYAGVAEIRRSGSVYTIAWQVGEARFVGSGLLAEGTLSFVFQGAGPAPGRPGVIVYRVLPDGTLAGVYVLLGNPVTGSETLTPLGQGASPGR